MLRRTCRQGPRARTPEGVAVPPGLPPGRPTATWGPIHHCECARDLTHKRVVRMWRDAQQLHATRGEINHHRGTVFDHMDTAPWTRPSREHVLWLPRTMSADLWNAHGRRLRCSPRQSRDHVGRERRHSHQNSNVSTRSAR